MSDVRFLASLLTGYALALLAPVGIVLGGMLLGGGGGGRHGRRDLSHHPTCRRVGEGVRGLLVRQVRYDRFEPGFVRSRV